MGKLILCTGKRADTPFVISLSHTKIYSIEELSYYLNENIYSITVDLFDDKLLKWIREELDMKELAEKLKTLRLSKKNVRDMAVAVICSADYYTEPEVKAFITTMNRIAMLPPVLKLKIQADNYMKYGQYALAGRVYTEIIHSEDAAILSEKEYGNILHNLAVICVRTVSFREAANMFLNAYRKNQREESLKQGFFCMAMTGNDKELQEFCEKENITKEKQLVWMNMFSEQEEKTEESIYVKEMQQLKKLKKDGKITEYYQKTDQLINEWKRKYREEVM